MDKILKRKHKIFIFSRINAIRSFRQVIITFYSEEKIFYTYSDTKFNVCIFKFQSDISYRKILQN